MTELWTFEIVEPVDVSGFDVEASDGHIGTIDEATYDPGTACLVVDTGFWIFGKKRMIPAGAITEIDLDDKRVNVDLTKQQIKDAPDYDEARREEESYRAQHTDAYGR
jgi:hypothetical protein